MKKIIVFSNPARDTDLEVAQTVKLLLSERAEVSIYTINYSYFAEDTAADNSPLKEELGEADFIVAIGGAGSIMHTARAAAPYSKPVIGINKGNKGFLAELDINNISLLEDAVDGRYTIEERMMLDVSIMRDGEKVFSNYAINDAAISGTSRMVSVSVFADGIKMATYAGDGVIIASPTGSTAYSMSAGGPIVEPTAKNIIVTPICSHALIAKPFVLAADRTITAEATGADGMHAFLSVDGEKGVRLLPGDTVRVDRSYHTTKLMKLTGKSFYETVREKLGER